jgi:AraC-like DNA-binding protein/ligand-binding sensor protein
MQTTIVGQASTVRSPGCRVRRSFPVSPRIQSRNGDAVSRNGDAARDKAALAASNEQGNGNGTGNRALIAALVNSRIYREYEQAFTDLTGLPVALQPVETWQLPHHGKRNENPFCSLMSQKSRTCSACLQVQERLCEKATHEPRTVTCPVGLCDIAVPVRLSDKLIGFLQTGQLFRKKPGKAQFARAARLVAEWGINVDRVTLQKAYFKGKVITATQLESTVKLLSIFAQHLAIVSNQVIIQQENAEMPVIKKAKEYIREHQSEKISLGNVAKAVNMSAFYFCKMFKKATGINFTDYLTRVRIERARNLLLNPNLRISEIGFEVGFQSLTHFNRVFKKIAGQSPTDYRAQLLVP